MTDTLYSVMATTDTPKLVAKMFTVWFPDARTVLDTTYGNGRFWWSPNLLIDVVGMDKDPARAPHICADFTALPFTEKAFDVVVFDPPYHTDMGGSKPSVMGFRFGNYQTIDALSYAVTVACLEIARVARIGVLVKVQDYIHASRLVRMTSWVETAMPWPLYDESHQVRRHKIIDPKWREQLSAYRNHATWLAFRRDGPIHKRRIHA